MILLPRSDGGEFEKSYKDIYHQVLNYKRKITQHHSHSKIYIWK